MFPVGGGGGHFDPNLNRAVRLNPQMSRSCQFKIWLKWDLDLDKDGGEVDRDGEVDKDEEEDDIVDTTWERVIMGW